MSDLRLGAAVRSLRRRLGWRQRDLGSRAGISQQHVSRLERGSLEDMTVRSIRAAASQLGATVSLELRWRGGDVDRLLDRAHATLVGRAMRRLEDAGFDVLPEVSYAIYGERGSVDIIAIDRARSLCVVVEVKSRLLSIEQTLRKHDEKVRLAAEILRRRIGWRPSRVLRLLVLPDESTQRRRVAQQLTVLRSAYPVMGRAVATWLRSPAPAADGGLLFLAATPARSASHHRVRLRQPTPVEARRDEVERSGSIVRRRAASAERRPARG